MPYLVANLNFIVCGRAGLDWTTERAYEMVAQMPYLVDAGNVPPSGHTTVVEA